MNSNTIDHSSWNPYTTDVVEQSKGWFIGLGIVLIGLGVIAISAPFAATLAVELLIGWLLVFSGIAHGIHAFQTVRWRGFSLQLTLAALNLLIGFVLVANPLQGVLALTLVLAAFFMIEGVFKIMMALQLKGMGHWGWLLLSGILGLVVGLLIGLEWPSTATWAIGLLLGIDLIFGGISLLMLVLAMRNSTQTVR
ncbi:MAG: HdeD family acid-resistance protein [Candidatus Competibacteraceae bacterium]|jgi:uncharacterized membrane protein HdeD (DUF308 family)|nr:HdeD family acid-resistance protein [Candidatus Competibacteraceae bacterium]